MYKTTHMMVSVAIAASTLFFTSGAQAAEASKGQVTKITAFLCKDVMRMSSDDRTAALGILHGYFLGKKGTTEYMDSVATKQTDDFIEYCLDHPNDKAFDSFAKFAK